MRTRKYTSFNEIPQFIQHGQWEADYQLHRVISNVDEFVTNFGLNLNPDFQRGHVWSEAQQRAYIEFFLKGGKTARVLYFNYPSWHRNNTTEYNEFVIVDGLQRLTAIRAFVDNRLKVFGSYFREFTDNLRIHNSVRINVNDLQTRADVLQWYLDFNTGGVVHTEEEIARVRAMLAREKRNT